MVITILEATIEEEHISDLEQAYQEGAAKLSADIVETFLVRNGHLFRIITVWTSRDALERMRASGIKPKGVQIFEAAGAVPSLTIWDVITHKK